MSRKLEKGDLLAAFKRCDIESIVKMCGNHLDSIPVAVEYKSNQGRSTPLNLAIKHGHYNLCRLLVEDGHPLNGDNEMQFRLNSLSLALRLQQFDIAELLIKSGADVNLLNKDKNTYPLFWAIHENQSSQAIEPATQVIDMIISAGFPINDPVLKKEGKTAMHCAVIEKNIKAVETLLKYPVNLNVVDLSRETALDYAIRMNFIDIVKILVEKGASLHNRNSLFCPLFNAIRNGHVEMVDLLLELGANLQEGWMGEAIFPPLHFAVTHSNPSIIKLLLGKGANVNAKNQACDTALHLAIFYQGFNYEDEKILKAMQIKLSKLLIAKGADVNAKDNLGRTPLDGAIYTENIELCKLLIKEGANVHGKGAIVDFGEKSNRFEYICCISAFHCPELVRICLDCGADYSYRDNHGLTPYHCVMAKHNPEMMRVFWQHGCPYDQPEQIPGKLQERLNYNPDPRDKKLLSLQAEFMDGIKNNRLDAVVNALNMGAEPKGCSMKIPFTLHYVAAKGNHKIAKTLLDHGVAVNKFDEKGQTPLYIAVEKKNLETCKVLLQYGACFDYKCKKLQKNRTIKALVKQDDQLVSLFNTIYKCFRLARQGDCKILKLLNKLKHAEQWEMLQVLMNCVNHGGFTLLATTLSLGHARLAEEMMQLRLNNL